MTFKATGTFGQLNRRGFTLVEIAIAVFLRSP